MGVAVSDYGRKHPGSGTVPPYSTMGPSRAPWNPDKTEDVEVTTEVARKGPIGPLREPSYGGLFVSLRLPGVHGGAEAIRRVAHGMQQQGWHLQFCDKQLARGWQNCALWEPGLGAAVHALAHRRLRDGADVWVEISKTGTQSSPSSTWRFTPRTDATTAEHETARSGTS